LCFGLLLALLNNSSLGRKKTKVVAGIVLVYILIQSIITTSGFYNSNLEAFPPRFVLVVLPAFLVIGSLFISSWGRDFIMRLDLKKLSFLSIVRIPVELSLLSLYINKLIPVEMTFEGLNFDILSGITAIFVSWFAFRNQKVNRSILWIWNLIALALLITIIIVSILSTPTDFQVFGMEQANIAILNFPFVLLPCFIVPVVFFTHLASIYQLIYRK